ncbi:capsular polysaccharide synthesis protein [Butyrivibrio sp. DSM 10294]|uniref:capsular polysaccharide synthesis protein n=1 Tax=Butyrivibrio sp. DSM 10294 TaxID=2972457 RepID=UPI00234F5BC1|nr:capsular polysaccharide synthesis protein [Butyrivibrio sp. DSM 10294]MDC7294827.1 capsular polysaccharide synthesis protein [Butyrivibrio sp. DSM 10294]
MPESSKLKNRIKERMLLGTIYDKAMEKFRYNDEKTSFLYSVMAGQKHRMIFYRRYKKRYLERCTAVRPWEDREKHSNSDVIWSMWLQGIDQAPEIVKKCYESQKKCLPDKKFVVLDEQNVYDYIDLPDFIKRKRQEGKIGDAHFSDLVRNELLIKYGGYWLDSTVFMTDGSLFEDIDKTQLFMISYYYFGFNPEIMELNNWFIHSTTNNNMLCLLQELLFAYWKDHDYAENYFLYHIMESIVNDFYQEDFKAMPIVSQAQAHVLATYIYDDYDANKWEMLKKTTGIHKLSTRFDKELLEKKGNFYNVVIKENI